MCFSINNAVLHTYDCDTQFRDCPAQLVIPDLRVQWVERYVLVPSFSVLHQLSLFTMVPVFMDTYIGIHFAVFFSNARCVH